MGTPGPLAAVPTDENKGAFWVSTVCGGGTPATSQAVSRVNVHQTAINTFYLYTEHQKMPLAFKNGSSNNPSYLNRFLIKRPSNLILVVKRKLTYGRKKPPQNAIKGPFPCFPVCDDRSLPLQPFLLEARREAPRLVTHTLLWKCGRCMTGTTTGDLTYE